MTSEKIIMEIPVEDWLWRQLKKKKEALKYHGKDIVNLILRGSHCDYAINPTYFKDPTFNFGTNNQDLFCTYYAYREVAPFLLNVQNVVVFYAFFLNGFNLLKTTEKWRCFYYKLLLNVPYEIEATNINDFPISMDFTEADLRNYFGYDNPSWAGKWDVEQRVARHMKEFNRDKHGLYYLQELALLCQKQNRNLHIVIPAYRSDYTSYVPSNTVETAINQLKEIVPEKNIHNFFKSPLFNDSDFTDPDHMNSSGAIKISTELNKILHK